MRFAGSTTVVLRRLGGPDAHAGVYFMNKHPLTGPLPFRTAFGGRAIIAPGVLAFDIFVAGSDGTEHSTALSIDKSSVVTVIGSEELGELVRKNTP